MNTTFKLEFLKIFKKVSITKTNSYSYKLITISLCRYVEFFQIIMKR